MQRFSGMPDPSHLLIARVHGIAGRSDDLTAAAEELARSARPEAGCLSFDVLAPTEAHAELVLVSAWRSDRDMRAHFASAAYGRYVSAVTDLLTRPSDVTIYGIAATVHPLPDLSTEPQRAS
jgi:quinol monooxygenase YgiN